MNRPHPVSPVIRRPPLKSRRCQVKTLLDLTCLGSTYGSWSGTTDALGLTGQTAACTARASRRMRWVLVRDPQGEPAPGLALHRSSADPTDPGMVCAALATGGHLPGGAPSGRGTQRSGRISIRTTPIPLFPGPPWRPICCGTTSRPIAQRQVRQAVGDLRGSIGWCGRHL